MCVTYCDIFLIKKGDKKMVSKTAVQILTENTSELSRPVVQLTTDGTFVALYPSITEAARAATVDRSDINKVVNGRRATAGGYKWVNVDGVALTNVSYVFNDLTLATKALRLRERNVRDALASAGTFNNSKLTLRPITRTIRSKIASTIESLI